MKINTLFFGCKLNRLKLFCTRLSTILSVFAGPDGCNVRNCIGVGSRRHLTSREERDPFDLMADYVRCVWIKLSHDIERLLCEG